MNVQTAEVAAPSEKQRYPALDSLRGLAALSVMFSHVALFAPYGFLLHSPLQIFMQGRSAVVLFFVLSGFVLALQISSKSFDYSTYAIKRFFRIYPAYIVSIIIAVICIAFVGQRDVSKFGSLGVDWNHPLGLFDVLNHVQMIFFPFVTGRFNGVIWSLVYEMRISLMFPVIMFGFYRFGSLPMLAFGFLCTAVYCILEFSGVSNAGNMAAWLPTLQYLTMFICGAALARSLVTIKKLLHKPIAAYILFALGTCSYILATPIAHRTTGVAHLQVIVSDAFVIAAVLAIMTSTFSKSLISKMLEQQILVKLGALSYSLYLFHLIVFNLLIHTLAGYIPDAALVVLEFILAIGLSFVTYYAVELPGMRFGAYIASKVRIKHTAFLATSKTPKS